MQISPPETPARSGAGTLALWWLLLCLVLVPTLGQQHQVSHGGFRGQPVLHQHDHGQADRSAAGHPGQSSASLTEGLLPGHAPADCLLLDQLALGDALHRVALSLPALVPLAGMVFRCATGRPAQPPALFEARAPPVEEPLHASSGE